MIDHRTLYRILVPFFDIIKLHLHIRYNEFSVNLIPRDWNPTTNLKKLPLWATVAERAIEYSLTTNLTATVEDITKKNNKVSDTEPG